MAGRRQMPAEQWLARIAAMRRQARPGDIANLRVLANGLGMTPDYLRRQHIAGDAEFPLNEAGKEGRDYEFDVIAALNHLFWRGHERLGRERAEAARVARLTGASASEGDEPMVEADGLGTVSVTDLGRLIDVNQKLMKARAEQGMLIPKVRVQDFLIAYNSEMQAGILGTEQKVDPLGQMPVETRVLVHESLRQLCVDQSTRIERFLNPDAVAPAKRTAKRGRSSRR